MISFELSRIVLQKSVWNNRQIEPTVNTKRNMNGPAYKLRQHLSALAHQHSITQRQLLVSFQLEPNFFTNPHLQISLGQTESPTLSQKTKNNKQDIKEEELTAASSDHLQMRVESLYKQIHYMLRQKYKNGQVINQEGFRTEKLGLCIDNKKQWFVIAYNSYESLESANVFHTQYKKMMASLKGYIPHTYVHFVNYVSQKLLYITYLIEVYESLSAVSNLFLKNDHEKQILDHIFKLEETRETLNSSYELERMDVGFTTRDSSIKWIPFSRLSQSTTIEALYHSLFLTHHQSALNLQNLYRACKRKQYFQNQLYFLTEQPSSKQNTRTLVYSLNQTPTRIEVMKVERPRRLFLLKNTKKIYDYSKTQYIKMFENQSFNYLTRINFKEYLTTKVYSKLDISPCLYEFQQQSKTFCYFKIKKYMGLNEVLFSKSYLFEKQRLEGISDSDIEEQSSEEMFICKRIIKKIKVDIGEELEHLHSNHVIHGDVSLLNVVYDNESNRFKLIDFEMALRINEEIGEMTHMPDGKGFGTPKYMSTEMKEVIEQKQSLIDLYKNDKDCLKNVIDFLKILVNQNKYYQVRANN